jgi:hypothetical protein
MVPHHIAVIAQHDESVFDRVPNQLVQRAPCIESNCGQNKYSKRTDQESTVRSMECGPMLARSK